MIAGTIYGIALNDADQRAARAVDFTAKPHAAPPVAPIVYIKPATCRPTGPVRIPADGVEAAPTIGLLFRREAAHVSAETAMDCVGALCLALDIATERADFYRPAIAQSCRDGFLPLGAFASAALPPRIETWIDGEPAHSWSLDRLVRPGAMLIAELSAFMTLRAGDLLLIGLPGDAPHVLPGQNIRVEAAGLPALETRFEGPSA